MKIELETFIMAVQERPSLWKLQEKRGSDRDIKLKMWNEVGEICFQTWNDLSTEEKEEKVIFLQRKWKTIRDYYKRVRRINSSAVFRTKKYSYLKYLQFLDNNIKEQKNVLYSNTSESSVEYLDDTYETIYLDENELKNLEVIQEVSTSNARIVNTPEKPKKTDFKADLLKIIDNKGDDDDSNKHFLLSLLPDMAKMTPRQNFSFRMEIMKAMEEIQYKDHT